MFKKIEGDETNAQRNLRIRQEVVCEVLDALEYRNGKSDDVLIQRIITSVEDWARQRIVSNVFRSSGSGETDLRWSERDA